MKGLEYRLDLVGHYELYKKNHNVVHLLRYHITFSKMKRRQTTE